MNNEIQWGEIRKHLEDELNRHLYLPVGASEESRQRKDEAVNEFLDAAIKYLHTIWG